MAEDMGSNSNGKLNPEVTAKPVRRRHSADFKRSVLKQADALEASGGSVGEMLRQNGLYRAQLAEWRRAVAERGSEGLMAQKPGRKVSASAPSKESKSENAKLARRVATLERKLRQAEAIIDIQKKVAALLAMPDDESES